MVQKKRLRSQEEEGILPPACPWTARWQNRLPPEFPTCQPALKLSDLPTPTIGRDNSLNCPSISLSFVFFPSRKFYWFSFSGEPWPIQLAVIPSSDIHALVQPFSLECGLDLVIWPSNLLCLTNKTQQKWLHFFSLLASKYDDLWQVFSSSLRLRY